MVEQINYKKFYRCKVCLRKTHTLHHIVSRKAGGSDHPDNLIPLCHLHHTGDEGVHRRGVETFFCEDYPELRELLIKARHRKMLEHKVINKLMTDTEGEEEKDDDDTTAL